MKVTIAASSAFVLLVAASPSAAQSNDPGRLVYANRCASCHGSNGNGGELGPSIVMRVPARTDDELRSVVQQGLPTAGMPAFANLTEAELRDLITFLRTLRPREGSGPTRTTLTLTTGRSLEGLILNQGGDDLQLLGDDRKLHLVRKEGIDIVRSPRRPTGRATTVRRWGTVTRL
jgi:alcohol dehydrogenase (cytochrome c)